MEYFLSGLWMIVYIVSVVVGKGEPLYAMASAIFYLAGKIK